MGYTLKPCPFCGHTAHLTQLKGTVKRRYYVTCGNNMGECIASADYVFGKKYKTKEEAARAWNRRAATEGAAQPRQAQGQIPGGV